MSDSVNTYFGWALFAGVVGLGLSSISGKYFQADKHEHLEFPGYVIVAEEGGAVADAGPSLATVLSEADAVAGEKAFTSRCGTCHTADQGGASGNGPNLFGVLGKGMGTQEAGFAYSSDLAAMGDSWSYENIDAWLTKPRALVGGTKMSFAGLSKADDRADIILFMRSAGGGPELPTPEVAEEIVEAVEGEDAAVEDEAVEEAVVEGAVEEAAAD